MPSARSNDLEHVSKMLLGLDDIAAEMLSVSMEGYAGPSVALVIANGPSTKDLDFKQVERSSLLTVGMNSAYRYWETIDFRPTHYICMDTTVIMSHADAIYSLVNEGRIKKFFLRDEIKSLYPELAERENILWFEHARSALGIFSSNFITTGSWAIRWMAAEGAKTIATIGIDANYVEVLPISRAVEGRDLELEIVETPAENPNYFFGGYQQAGDKYNIPNSPEYLRKTGRLVHVDALQKAKDDIEALFTDVIIFDLSAISAHGIFRKKALSEFLLSASVRLITSFHSGIDDAALQHNVSVACVNALNPELKCVSIIFEGSETRIEAAINRSLAGIVENLKAAGRLNVVSVPNRPSFKRLFDSVDEVMGLAIVTNADVVVPSALIQTARHQMYGGWMGVLALTRWNRTDRGFFLQGLDSSPPWATTEAGQIAFEDRNYFSFDTYVVTLPFEVPDAFSDVYLGSLGCDTALAAILKLCGYSVINPCLDCKTFHYDEKRRHYSGDASRADLIRNLAACRDAVVEKFKDSAAALETLKNASRLQRELAWVGHAKSMNFWHATFRLLGATPWTISGHVPDLTFVDVVLNEEQILESRWDPSELEERLDSGNVFIRWKLCAGSSGRQIVELFKDRPRYETLYRRMLTYQWQSFIDDGRAQPALKQLHQRLLVLVETMLRDAFAARQEMTKTVVSVDPDAVDEWGHFLSYDMRLGEVAIASNYSYCVVGNEKSRVERLEPSGDFIRALSSRSWELGRLERPHCAMVAEFSEELSRAILRIRRKGGEEIFLYMYCGSLNHLLAVMRLVNDRRIRHANVNLFWMSFVDYHDVDFVRRWRSTLDDAVSNPLVRVTVPTSRLQRGVERAFGHKLLVAPHPSTTFRDEFASKASASPARQLSDIPTVLFPGGVRIEKGFNRTLDVVQALTSQRGVVRCVVRSVGLENAEVSITERLKKGEFSRVEFNSDKMEGSEFSAFLNTADVIVLPYTAAAFAERTSGLLVDSLLLGIPVVVIEGTWLADFVKSAGMGVVVEDTTDGVVKGIGTVLSTFEQFSVRARGAVEKFLKENSWSALLHSVTEQGEFSSPAKAPVPLRAIISDLESPNQGLKVTSFSRAFPVYDASVTGHFERDQKAQIDECQLVERLALNLREPGIMIDVGAHFGGSLGHFADSGWTVYAFEPDPANRAKLVARIRDKPNVILSQEAVSDTAGQEVAFYASDESSGISALSAFRDTHREVARVRTVTLDTVVARHDIARIDFLKIDVEGFEMAVLRGLDFDRIKPAVVLAEYEDDKTRPHGYDVHDLCRFLTARGYHVYVSEWHPIERYGIKHSFRRIQRYPCEVPPDSWGNLIAFQSDPAPERLKAAIRAAVDRPVRFVDEPETDVAQAPVVKPEPVRPVAASATSATSGMPARAAVPTSVTSAKVQPALRRAVILGNGPSLKDFDLTRLTGIDSFGMNAAYRHWDRIGWYPTHYACLDEVVGLSHKDDIARLIRDRARLGIRKFLLRANLIGALGAEADTDAVVDFDALRRTGKRYARDPVTTGSHCLIWAVESGYREIVLLGVDADYTELVPGAERGPGLELRIGASLPNPNYFFEDYQRVGDRFQVPNASPGVHVGSWRAAASAASELGAIVLNANEKSAVDAFDFCAREDLFQSAPIAATPRTLVLDRRRRASLQRKVRLSPDPRAPLAAGGAGDGATRAASTAATASDAAASGEIRPGRQQPAVHMSDSSARRFRSSKWLVVSVVVAAVIAVGAMAASLVVAREAGENWTASIAAGIAALFLLAAAGAAWRIRESTRRNDETRIREELHARLSAAEAQAETIRSQFRLELARAVRDLKGAVQERTREQRATAAKTSARLDENARTTQQTLGKVADVEQRLTTADRSLADQIEQTAAAIESRYQALTAVQLEALRTDAVPVAARLDSRLEENARATRQALGTVADVKQRLTTADRSLADHIEQTAGAIEARYQALSAAQLKACSEAAEVAARFDSRLDEAERAAQQAIDRLSEMERRTSELDELNRAISNRFEQLVPEYDARHHALVELSETLAGHRAQIAAEFDTWQQRLAADDRGLSDRVEAIASENAALHEKLVALQEQAAKDIGHRLETSLSAVAQRAAELRDDVFGKVNDAEKRIRDLDENGIKPLLSRLDATHAEHSKIQSQAAQAEKRANSSLHSLSRMNASNAAQARPHVRLLDAASLDRLLTHWLPIFGLSMSRSALSYLAHRICLMEDHCEGRVATTINALILRLLAMRSLGPSPELKVLEIGTLFGIGGGLFHAFRGPDIARVRLTIIDPLSGYYSKGQLDPVTGVPISAETVIDNLSRLRVPRDDFRILRGLSQDPAIKAKAAASRYNLILVDGDHSREGVRRDFELYAPLLEPGGILLFDDYDTSDWPEVKEAVDRILADAKGWKWLGSEWRTGILKSTEEPQQAVARPARAAKSRRSRSQ